MQSKPDPTPGSCPLDSTLGAGNGLLADVKWYHESMIQKVITKRNLQDHASMKDDLAYWLSRPPEERVAAVDVLRKQYHGTSARLQRTARVVQRT